jgi:hypothetical protein
MNRATFVGVVASVFLLTANCSQQGPGQAEGAGGSGGTTTGAGGATGSGGQSSGSGGAGGSGGVSGSGGENAGGSPESGGASGSCGDTSESGGASGSGGRTTAAGGNAGASAARGGAAGSSARGGATGSGGASARGGATGSGGAGSGGASTGSGGAMGTGGRGTGGAGTGGVNGTGGSGTGGSSAAITPADIVPDLAAGFYWEGTCGGTISVDGHNCPMTGTGINRETPLKVGGESGKKYTVNIEVRGVIGTRCYKGGTRASTASAKEDDYNNWWYIGGTYANATGWWNTYELKVTPSTGDADQYYFNGSDNDGGSYCEREASYLVGYTASFKVMGGGTMTFKIHDQNCKAIQNCGKSIVKTDPCQPRTVDLSKMSLQPPTSSPAAKQPPKNDQWYPQWMWIVATSVTPA